MSVLAGCGLIPPGKRGGRGAFPDVRGCAAPQSVTRAPPHGSGQEPGRPTMAGKFDVQTEIVDFIKNLFTHKDLAQKFASDPHGTLAEQGITDHDLSGVDMPNLVGEACQSVDLPADTKSVLQSYSSGSPQPSGGYSPPPPSSYSSGVE